MKTSTLDRLSAICFELPEAQRERRGDHASFMVRKKIFAYYLSNHHGDGIVSICAKVLPGDNGSLIAADPSVLPLGSRVRLDAGAYSGDYLVADTGGGVHGKRIDIWTPNSREATRFGRRKVKLTVLSYGKRNLLHRRHRH